MTDVPGFLAPTAEGHVGEIRSYDVGGVADLACLGRTHLYEGHGLVPVVHGVRTAYRAGVRTVVLTNANGSLRDDWELGRPVLVADHLNVTGTSPLEGARFVDLTDAWSPRLRAVARAFDPSLAEGVYAWLRGPHYETWAEAAWLRRVGADMLGMSTVPEAIAAREWKMEVVGISTVTAVEGDCLGHRPGRGRRGRRAHGEPLRPAAGGAGHERCRSMSSDARIVGHRSPRRPASASRPTASTSSTRPSARARPSDLFWPWCASNVSVLAVSYGAFVLGFGLGLWQALVAAVVGAVAGFLLVGLVSIAGKRGSAPTLVLSRAPFGRQRQPAARRGVLPAAGRLGDRAGLAGDVRHRDRLRPARLGRRQPRPRSSRSWSSPAVIVGAGILGFDAIMRLQKWLTIAMIVGHRASTSRSPSTTST